MSQVCMKKNKNNTEQKFGQSWQFPLIVSADCRLYLCMSALFVQTQQDS